MSKDFDIGFRVFCCLGFKKEFWFLFFLSLSVCVSSRGRAKRFVLEASSLRVRRAKKAEAEEPRRIVRALVCVCVCGSDDGGGGVRDCILSLVVVEKKHITTKSNCVGLERELDRIW